MFANLRWSRTFGAKSVGLIESVNVRNMKYSSMADFDGHLTHESLTLTIVSAKINHFLYKFNE